LELRIIFEKHRLLIIVFISMMNGEHIFRLWHVFKLSWVIVFEIAFSIVNMETKTRNTWIGLCCLLSQKLKLEGLNLILFHSCSGLIAIKACLTNSFESSFAICNVVLFSHTLLLRHILVVVYWCFTLSNKYLSIIHSFADQINGVFSFYIVVIT
jgi:hypothetical protein